MEKVFHPTMRNSTVEQIDPETLMLCATFLHDLGWCSQQVGFDSGANRLRFWRDRFPDDFLKACSNGLTVILDYLSENAPDTLSGIADKQDIHPVDYSR